MRVYPPSSMYATKDHKSQKAGSWDRALAPKFIELQGHGSDTIRLAVLTARLTALILQPFIRGNVHGFCLCLRIYYAMQRRPGMATESCEKQRLAKQGEKLMRSCKTGPILNPGILATAWGGGSGHPPLHGNPPTFNERSPSRTLFTCTEDGYPADPQCPSSVILTKLHDHQFNAAICVVSPVIHSLRIENCVLPAASMQVCHPTAVTGEHVEKAAQGLITMDSMRDCR